MDSEAGELKDFVGHCVVLDTKSQMLYIGQLDEVKGHYFILSEADVHDMSEGRTTKEVYVMEAKKFGNRKNRENVAVRKEEVISISKLDDITVY